MGLGFDPRRDGLDVPGRRLRRRPWVSRGDGGGHFVELGDHQLELGQRRRVSRRNFTGVGLALTFVVVEVVAFAEGFKRRNTQRLRQFQHAALSGARPLTSHLENLARREGKVEVAPAHTVTRLEHQHRMTCRLDRVRGRQPCESGAHNDHVVLPDECGAAGALRLRLRCPLGGRWLSGGRNRPSRSGRRSADDQPSSGQPRFIV